MRLIKTFTKEDIATNFSLFLQKAGIRNFLDMEINDESKQFAYQVWVYDEDQLELAEDSFMEFEKADPATFVKAELPPSESPLDPETPPSYSASSAFKRSTSQESNSPGSNRGQNRLLQFKHTFHSHTLTSFVLLLCGAIYLLNLYQEKIIIRDHPQQKFVVLTPVIGALLFDVPYMLMEYDALIKKYNVDPMQNLEKQDPAFLEAIKKVEDRPYWMGIDELLKKKFQGESISLNAPLFEKIREGQVWRFFSPAFLHKDFLHLLFNMLWLWILGRPIEERIRKYRYLVLILTIAFVSNVCQYLVSGPNFLGYSGVVMGMVGFIWVRQKIAPWEGYVLQKTTYLFLGAYVFLMMMLSLVTFFSRVMGSSLFAVNIANTAHIVGALVGIGLARYCPFFKEQV